jgi:hypothetical protein
MSQANVGSYIYIGLRSDGGKCLLEQHGNKFIDCRGREHTGVILSRLGGKEASIKKSLNGKKTIREARSKECVLSV